MAYATPDQFRSFAAYLGAVIDLPDNGSDQGIADLLQRSSDDISAFLCWPPPPDPADPDEELPPDRIPADGLSRWEQRALTRATMVQACYRLVVDEDTIAEGQPTILSAGGVTFANASRAMIGGETFMAISACPSLWWHRSGTVQPDPVPTTSDDGSTVV